MQQPHGSGGQPQQPMQTFPGQPQHQQQRPREPWPAAMFTLPSSSNAGSSQQQQQQSSRSIAGFSSSGRGPDATSSQTSLTNLMPSMGLTGGMSGGTAAAAAAAAGDPTTPVGSPVRVNRGMGSAAGAGSAGNSLASPPSWFSPTSRVRYSDRFIPSRYAMYCCLYHLSTELYVHEMAVTVVLGLCCHSMRSLLAAAAGDGARRAWRSAASRPASHVPCCVLLQGCYCTAGLLSP
jgi:hypothetical protein